MNENQRKEIARRMGRRVRIARTCKGIATDVLAERAGLTHRQFVRFEEGRGSVTADELVAIARVLDVPLWFVFEVTLSGDTKGCPICDCENPAR
jgi:transcriptional regulator with XRE-family HTH domain